MLGTAGTASSVRSVTTEPVGTGQMAATVRAHEIADYLVARGLPFRSAHEVTGRIVRDLYERGADFNALALEDWREYDARFDEGVFRVVTPEAAVAAKKTPQSTNPAAVAAMLADTRAWIGGRLARIMRPRAKPVRTHGLTHIALAVRIPSARSRSTRPCSASCRCTATRPFVQAQTPGSRDVLVFEKAARRAGRSGGHRSISAFASRRARDIERAIAAVRRAGGRIKSSGEFVPGEPYVFFEDPDGYEVEIWYELPTPVDPRRPASQDMKAVKPLKLMKKSLFLALLHELHPLHALHVVETASLACKITQFAPAGFLRAGRLYNLTTHFRGRTSMRGRIRPVVPAVFALLVGAVTLVAAAAPRVTFTEHKLKNGLRVIISEDHTAPVYSIAVTYNVGSRDERKGRTGFAHLFEHMMFKGSEQVGPGEHFTLVFNNGGNMNGTTNKDRTLYFETLPSNQLDLGLFLEADRMWSLEITKENLENQRNAVQEERRLGLDNQPYGKSFELIEELAYENPAYEHSVIGSMADLSAATVEDVSAFFKTYYAPNNAVVSIVGDVKTAEVLEKMRKYFERIPSQPPPAPVDMTEPAQTAERRQTVDDALARLPRVDMVWHTPAALAPDDDALTVMAAVLSSGRSSRFYSSIVLQQQLSSGVERVGGRHSRSRPVPGRRNGPARKERRRSREGDLRRDRQAQGGAAGGVGAREGAQQLEALVGRGARQFAAARDHARPLRVVLERSESDQHLSGPDREGHRRGRAARGEAVLRRPPTARS